MEAEFNQQTAHRSRRGFLRNSGLLGAAAGGPSAPGDPNAAFCLDGVYHLHYILRHPFRGKNSFCSVHVSSPGMLHWTWHQTRLQPSFAGHGMFSGTGFLTKEGKPAVIYHGQGSGWNQIAITKDDTLEEG